MTLAHDEAGDGPAVLLLHSTVADRRMWDPQEPALIAAGFRVIRCDLRGYGETPVADRSHNDADDVAELLDELGVERAALVGASGGGMVALEFAGRRPARVTALALLDTAAPWLEPGPELREFNRREEELLEAGDVAAATELNVDLWLGPAAGPEARSRLREMQRHTFEWQLAAAEWHEKVRTPYELSAVTARTLLVAGAHDLPEFRALARRLAAELPDAHLIELDWAGHLPSLERPDLLNPILLDFLNQPGG